MRQQTQAMRERGASWNGKPTVPILLRHEKQLCTDWLKVILMSPLIFLLFLRFRAPASPRKTFLCRNRAREQESTNSSCTCALAPTGYCNYYCELFTQPHHTSVTEGGEKTFLFFHFTLRWLRHKFKLEIHLCTNKRKLPGVILDY